jgi:hypothetical protein
MEIKKFITMFSTAQYWPYPASHEPSTHSYILKKLLTSLLCNKPEMKLPNLLSEDIMIWCLVSAIAQLMR